MKKSNFICLVLLALILQAGCVTVKKDINAKIISSTVYTNEVEIDKGEKDGVEKRQLYNVYDGETKIAKVVVTRVKEDKSIGKIIRRYNKGRSDEGDSAEYINKKIKTNSIGISAMIANPNRCLFVPVDTGDGGEAIYYEYLDISGFGLRLGYGYHEYIVDIPFENRGGMLQYPSDENIYYSYPILLKYQFFYGAYIGLGLSHNKKTFTYLQRNNNGWVEIAEKFKGWVPVYNAGINFVLLGPFHWGLDYQYLKSVKNDYDNKYSQIGSLQLSVNW